jgi:hypothetical protein
MMADDLIDDAKQVGRALSGGSPIQMSQLGHIGHRL